MPPAEPPALPIPPTDPTPPGAAMGAGRPLGDILKRKENAKHILQYNQIEQAQV